MHGTWCVLAFIVLYVELAQSWDIAISKGYILDFYTNDVKTESIHFNYKNLTALTYDEVHNMMLYIDKQNGNDVICGYDISSKKCFTVRNWRDIHGLAFDPVTEKLFFSDKRERSINWISLKDGFFINIYGNLLIRTGAGIPTDIAVDSCRGYVYWINSNLRPPTIERARFDGTERQVIIASMSTDSLNKLEPHSLVIDQQTQKMFWIEPETRLKYYIYTADLNGNKKEQLNSLTYKDTTVIVPQPSSNVLTVSKTSLYWTDWCSNCYSIVWERPKTTSQVFNRNLTLNTIGAKASIVSYYKIEDKLPANQDCDALKSIVRNNACPLFCVHGTKVSGQSLCKCSPGYIGERCDVSVCDNYCLQGYCTLNDQGLPQCRCHAGYSGSRCEVFACYGYCLNSGVCSLTEASQPSCQCVDGHIGPRCEVDGNISNVIKSQY